MPLIRYTKKRFSKTAIDIINQSNSIISAYFRQGYDLTLRQLYYQFVSRDLFPDSWKDPKTGSTNNQASYKKLGTIISDARRGGYIDWDRIVDRTRNVHHPSWWDTPSDLVRICSKTYDVDWWDNQQYRVDVWVEKDALIGVLETACREWHCPYFSCRGYTSDSEIWQAANRFEGFIDKGQKVVVLHLGDHDPSGIDMSRDIEERLNLFCRNGNIEVKRLALNRNQVDQYNPPPNPAKSTDTRFTKYQEEHGDESWELDALEPQVISGIIATEMNLLIDQDKWEECKGSRDEGRRLLGEVSKGWDKITKKM